MFLHESNNSDLVGKCSLLCVPHLFSSMNTELIFKLARALILTISAQIDLAELTMDICANTQKDTLKASPTVHTNLHRGSSFLVNIHLITLV